MSIHFRHFAYRLTLGLSFAAISFAVAATKPAAEFLTSESTLSNGLKVIIREDHRAPIVMTQIWYKVGSSDESGNTLGISHVLEHLMFKGTNKVPNDEFTRLSRLYGGKINASTFTNYTTYYQLYPKAYFPLALELEADRMHNLKLQQQDFETEIRVVMEERRQRIEDNPRALAFERFKWISYPTSHYRQPIIGHLKTLQTINLADLKTWYKQWYQPNNAILVIVGDVETQSALHQVQKYFGDINSARLNTRNDVTEFPAIGYRHQEIHTNVHIPNLYLAWNTVSLKTAAQPTDALALVILAALLDKGISSRLEQNLVRKNQILSSVSVSYDPYNRGDSLFSISALPHQQVSLHDAQQAILNEIESIKYQGVTQQELDRVVKQYIAQHIYNQDDLSNQAQMIGNLEVNGLSFRWIDELPKQLRKLDSKEIQRVAQQYLSRSRLSSLFILPESTAVK